jgi:hypothetical protein
VPKTVRSVKTIKNTNSYDDIMPSTFIKSKLSKTTEFDLDDLEKDLAELNKSSETN